MNVPFVDLTTQYRSIKESIDDAIQTVIDEAAFIRGRHVQEFEESFGIRYGVRHCASVASGTDAIYVSLKALGVGPGDEVITVANSWISTSETITQAGAKPVFVDIEPNYYTIDVDKVAEKISDRTKAIIPVHLFGQPSEMDVIKRICEEYGLFLIEDCAQAHFAEFSSDGGSSRKVGTFGHVGAFSFYPGKNLGAYGDAGAIVTDDDELARRLVMFANHGSLTKHCHEMEGINSRMDGLQAAVLRVKLDHIGEWTRRRVENGAMYRRLLADVDGVTTPAVRPNGTHVFHLYVVRTDDREGLRSHLTARGIGTGIHYPVALPFLNAYRYLRHSPEEFPVAHRYQDQILSLPMYPELTGTQIEYVAEQIAEYFD